MTTILILGATGLVGQQLLQQALALPQLARVIAPTRRALATHPKLDNPLVDFEHLPAAPWWRADMALCALGTTIKQAGSQAAFYKVDHDVVLACAKLAQAEGTPAFVLNSSLGAKLGAGSFYLRVKAETERDLAALGFASLTLVRPSLLDGGPRPQARPGEAVAIFASKLLGPLLPKRVRPISTAKVASAMLAAGLRAAPGCTVLESEVLH
jgi:uncharacterized protein YbjT (DUF2867 family)